MSGERANRRQVHFESEVGQKGLRTADNCFDVFLCPLFSSDDGQVGRPVAALRVEPVRGRGVCLPCQVLKDAAMG